MEQTNEKQKNAQVSIIFGAIIGIAMAKWVLLPFVELWFDIIGSQVTPGWKIGIYAIMIVCSIGILNGAIMSSKALENAAYGKK